MITSLFSNLESRGTDASGVWATETSKNSRIVYHKEAIRSSEFVKGEFWQDLKKSKLNMMLIHARAASKGGGIPAVNSNNHPFVSLDKRLAMVHNGSLEEAEFLKDKYEILSMTDSEYILRMYEHGLDKEYFEIKDVPNDIAWRLNAINEIWSVVSAGAMAVALGEWIDENTRALILFRNDKRPLWLADMRKSLGQIFFISSPDIWFRALAGNDELKKLCWSSQKLCELPPQQVWYLMIDKEDPIVTDENLFKFGVSISDNGKDWEKGNYCSIKTACLDIPVISPLDEEVIPPEPEIIKPTKLLQLFENKSSYDYEATDCDDENETNEGFQEIMPPRNDHAAYCESIKQLAERIYTDATNMVMEGSLSVSDYQSLLESLEQTRYDLEGTLRILTH